MNAPIDPAVLAHELSKRGETWADANAAAEALEETKATVLSQIAVGRIQGGDSAAKAELFARGSEEYRDHISKMVEARRAANRARVRFDTYKAYIELVRSAESTRRAEANIR